MTRRLSKILAAPHVDTDLSSYGQLASDESVTGLWNFDEIQMNPNGTPTASEGAFFYDSNKKAMAYFSDTPQQIHIGQEASVRVRNQTGSTIAAGTPVYISGATGQTLTIALAKADALATAEVLGLVQYEILNNAYGYVVTIGECHNIDTSSWSDGDALYLSAATAGTLTSTAPTGTDYLVHVGHVSYSHGVNGKIQVAQAQKPQLASPDHGSLSGLTDDDHTQYTRKDTLTTTGDIYVHTGAGPARLGSGTANYPLAGNGVGSVPSYQAPSSIIDSIGSTRGSLLYRGVGAWSALTPGTSGYVLTSNGAGADPSWQASSGISSFTSANQALATTISVAHGLGSTPTQVRCVLVCTISNLNYSVGDEVDMTQIKNSGSVLGTVWANATNVGFSINSTALFICNKTTGTWTAITTADWQVKFYAHL